MNTTETETLIIGSGVAATAIATRLLEKHPLAKITILEAGNKIKMRDFALYQNYLITNKLPFDSQNIYDSCSDQPYPDRDKPGENLFKGDTEIPLNGARLLVYGGSTVHWGGWAFRLRPEDFQLATNLKKNGINVDDIIDWPITYDDLEKYYCQAEQFIGVSGNSKDGISRRSADYPYRAFPYTLEDQLFIEAFGKTREPISYSNMPIARYGTSSGNNSHGPCHTTGLCKYCPFGARFVAANNMDDLVASARFPNLTVMINAVADQIIMASKGKASGVAFFNKRSGQTETINAERIIVASGAIEGPKLLQRSVSSFWTSGIGNDRDLVGRYLITHPYFFYKATLPENKQMLQPEMGFPTLVSRHFDSPAAQAKGKFILINPPTSPKVNLARQMSNGVSKADILKQMGSNVGVQLQGIMEVFSDKRNRVLNSDKKNRFGMKETEVNFYKGPNTDQRIAEIGNIAAEIFTAMGAKNTGVEIPISWRADHAACTTRMSDSDEEGVVDRDLKVHGIENLYVCSNSSFSSLGSVNPTLTLTALSLRLADHLSTL